MCLTLDRARDFIYKNARPLDLSRWNYHFENGSKEDVIKALQFYQNQDGGFGHALEADSWNPNSSPIQTWEATEILREINFTDNAHPIIRNVLHYLESGKDFDDSFWYNTVRSNNDYPHAPWWHTESDSTCHNDYNPTACLAGFIIRFSDRQSDIFQLGCHIAQKAFKQLLLSERENDMHTLSCFIRLMQYCKEAEVTNLIDLSVLESKLKKQVNDIITQDKTKWEASYICKPSQFINSTDSDFYSENKDIADYECEYIIKSQLEDGSWNIPWNWTDYPEEWAVAKNWWKANVVIQNLLYLNGVGGV